MKIGAERHSKARVPPDPMAFDDGLGAQQEDVGVGQIVQREMEIYAVQPQRE